MNKDWHDVELLALHDPVLHAAVTMVRQGASREEALIAAALALAEQVASLRGQVRELFVGGKDFVTRGFDYRGPITVGDHFIWMKDTPRAWAHVVVTKVDTADSHGDPFDERRIWTRVVHGTTNRTGSEAWNEEGRFREAVTPCDERGVERPAKSAGPSSAGSPADSA